jgi:hypothetical protein
MYDLDIFAFKISQGVASIRSNIRSSTKVIEGPGLEIPISDWLQSALRV